VAAHEAQGRDLARIVERVSPGGLTIEYVGGERYALRNNGTEACEVLDVVNRRELVGLMLKFPVRVESRRAVDFFIAKSLASMSPPANMVLDVAGKPDQMSPIGAAVPVPGARLRMMWRREGSEASKIEPTGMPLKVTLRVAYADDASMTYGDRFDLDLEGVGRAVPMAATGESYQGRDNDLRNVRLGIDALSKHVGELRR
jgi:hypothetical protein